MRTPFAARRRLFTPMMDAEADERLFTAVIIKKLSVPAAGDRLKACAIYEVVIRDFDREFLASLATEGHAS